MSDWQDRTLGEIAEWGSGGTPRRGKSEYFGEGVPWLSIADLNDGIVFEAKESLTPLGIANSSAKVVPAGTVFVAMYGSIGKLGIAGTDMATSQAIAFAQPNPALVDTRFLFHFLLSQRPVLSARGRGGTQQNIGQADLKAWKIPLPPLSEQRRIAEILDQADQIRTDRQAMLAKLEELPQSLFHQMFGDGAKFNKATLSDISAIGSGITKGRRTSEPTQVVPYLAVSNVQAGYLNLAVVKTIEATGQEIERYSLQNNDLLLTEGGDPDKLGRGALWHNEIENCIHQNHVYRVRIADESEIVPVFLESLVGSAPSKKYFLACAKQTTGIATINRLFAPNCVSVLGGLPG